MTISRRCFVGATAWLAVAGRAAAQRSKKLPRVALVFAASPVAEMMGADPLDPGARGFVHGLRDLGLVDGRDIVIVRRSAEGQHERLSGLMRELVAEQVAVIVTLGTGVYVAQRVTNTVPIVGLLTRLGDAEMVASLARPGRNVTGVDTEAGPGINGKRLQLLKEIAPGMSRVAFLGYRGEPEELGWRPETQAAARALKLDLFAAEADEAVDYEAAFASISRQWAGGMLVIDNPLNFHNRRLILDFANRQRLATVHTRREWVTAGGLISYGASRFEMFRRVASYVKRILGGEKPADLPIEQPTRFELVINAKTAKALGLTIPQALLLRADEVIE